MIQALTVPVANATVANLYSKGACPMRTDNRWEEMDKDALHTALLALHTCPHCRSDLRPVALFEDVWGCADPSHSFETWHIPKTEERA
jgi:hypothetical protein